jgi:glucose-1-phosphate adenylyltransferase
MGVYVFNTEELVRRVCEDARHESHHDFGQDILPGLAGGGAAMAYLFKGAEPREGAPAYWRDIGTIDSYYAANRELLEPDPLLDIHTHAWPIRTYHEQRPPAKFVGSEIDGRACSAVNSIVASGCLICGATIERSILSAGVNVQSGCRIADSILLEDVEVGRSATIRRAIIDKGVKIPAGESIGVDPELDRRRFTVSPGGIVVVPKEMLLSSPTRAINLRDSE